MESRRFPLQRPVGLVRLAGDELALRLESERGERMATRLRPMTLRDALRPRRFLRRGRWRRACGR